MASFGTKLHTLRKAKGMSQEEVAGIVGVTRAAVQQWEKGKTHPSVIHAQELARFFGISLAAILGDETPHQSVDAELRFLPKDVADGLRASFLAAIETFKPKGKI